MNKILLLSSSVFGFAQFLYVFYLLQFHFYSFCVIFGILTSIANHGLSSRICKVIDRIAMFVLFHYNLFVCIRFQLIHSLFWLIQSIVFYFVSKKYDQNYLHILSHICVSINNILVSEYYFSKQIIYF